MWKLLCEGQPLIDIADQLANDTGANSALPDDIITLADSLVSKRLITRQRAHERVLPPSHMGPRQCRALKTPALPSVATCLRTLAAFHVSLKVRRLSEVVASAYTNMAPDAPAPDRDWSRMLTRRIEIAAMYYPFHADCLERTLTFVRLARRTGLSAEMRIGIDLFPFEAHAWAESAGTALNEPEEAVVRFLKLPQLTAPWLERARSCS